MFTFFLFVGGILLWVVQNLMFELKSNSVNFFEFAVSLIPAFGIVVELFLFAFRCFALDVTSDNGFDTTCLNASIKDTKFNRFFFNNLNWEQYDQEHTKC